MKKLQHNASGFSVVEITLAVVAVAIVAFASYYVYHAQKSTSATLKQTNNTVANDNLSKTKPQPETKVANGYLIISEWGVKLPLTSDITDAYYQKTVSGDGYQNVNLGTKSLTASDKACAADQTGPGYLGRETIAVHDKNAKLEPEWDRPVYSIKIGSYYYGYVGPQATCSDKAAVNQKQAAIATAFSKAAEGLKAVQ